MSILLSILGIIVLLVIAFFAIGLIAPRTYQGSLSASFPFPARKVYEALNDLESLSRRRKEIEKVEMLLPGAQGQRRWREIASMGGFAEFETLCDIPGKLIEVRLVRSSFGITGTWTYEMQETPTGTLLSLREKSRTDKLFTRSLLTLAGRNVTLRQEVRNLRALLNED